MRGVGLTARRLPRVEAVSKPRSFARCPGSVWQVSRRIGDRRVHSAADAAAAADAGPQDSGQPISVLPRLKEADPFKVLGIPDDSDFEEVQAARNFLVAEYQSHEASREAVEMAYERIMSQSFLARQRKGFRAGRGKRGERTKYEMPPTLKDKIVNLIDTGVTTASIARDMVAYVVFGAWSAASFPLNNAPTMLLVGYATYRTVKKRTLRKPDGPFLGNSPVFGALLLTFISMFISYTVSGTIAAIFPWHELNWPAARVGPFFFGLLMGPLNIFLK